MPIIGTLHYICNYNTPTCTGYTVSSNTFRQVHIQLKHSLAHLQDLANPYFGWCACINILYQPKQELNLVDMLENAFFVYAFGYMCLSVNSSQCWWMIAIFN